MGQHFATPDLNARYNYLTDRCAHAIHNLITSAPKLVFLNLDSQALTNDGLNMILAAVSSSPTLLWYNAKTIWPQDKAAVAVKAGQEHVRLLKEVSYPFRSRW
jgi:hypothetical protein